MQGGVSPCGESQGTTAGDIAQLVERCLRKAEAVDSSSTISTKK